MSNEQVQAGEADPNVETEGGATKYDTAWARDIGAILAAHAGVEYAAPLAYAFRALVTRRTGAILPEQRASRASAAAELATRVAALEQRQAVHRHAVPEADVRLDDVNEHHSDRMHEARCGLCPCYRPWLDRTPEHRNKDRRAWMWAATAATRYAITPAERCAYKTCGRLADPNAVAFDVPLCVAHERVMEQGYWAEEWRASVTTTLHAVVDAVLAHLDLEQLIIRPERRDGYELRRARAETTAGRLADLVAAMEGPAADTGQREVQDVLERAAAAKAARDTEQPS